MMNRIKKDQMPQTGLQEVQAENIRATSRPIWAHKELIIWIDQHLKTGKYNQTIPL